MAEKVILNSLQFFSIKHECGEVTIISGIRQVNLQPLFKLSVEYQGTCISSSLWFALGLHCDMSVI